MHIAAFCRREALLQLGGFYENHCSFGEDTYLWLLLLLTHPIYWEAKPLLWYHTEDSGLNWYYSRGVDLASEEALLKRPLLPCLTDPARLRSHCPAEYSSLLEHFLAREALLASLSRTSCGDFATAQKLRRVFPLMRTFRRDYAKLRIKLALPWLVPLVRTVNMLLK